MSISRRGFLKTAGASVVVLGTGGASWVLTRTPRAALAPWEEAGRAMDDVRMQALSHAILAPNPHNRQPWLVQLRGDKTIEVRCQLDRRLPQTDPFDRQITIGLGCFTALYQMAAAQLGYESRLEPFPEGEACSRLDERPVARVTLGRAPMKADPLWQHVEARRSNKEPFDTSRALAPQTVQRIIDTARVAGDDGLEVGFTTETARVERLRLLTFDAMEREWQTRRTLMESVDLMRIGKAEITANPDGINIGGAFPEALQLAGMLTRETLADPKSQAFAQTISMFRERFSSGMGYMWMTTRGNSRREQLQAGAAWLRLNLAATGAGVGFQPASQSQQEFPEMAPFYARVHDELGTKSPSRIQMLVRLGYGPAVDPSPRWPLETRIARA